MHDGGMATDPEEYWRRRELSPSSDRPIVADGDRRLALIVDVAVPRLNLFPDAVDAEADADGALGVPNRALCAPAWASTGDRDGERFVPHLTPGSLVGDDDDRLVDFLESNRDLAVPPATVTELSLVARDHTAGWRSSSTTHRPYSL
jgi:hypothetical protein